MRSSKHVSGQGEMDLGQMRAAVVTLPEKRVSYSSWLAFYSPLSSRGEGGPVWTLERWTEFMREGNEMLARWAKSERNAVTVKRGPGSDLFGGGL